MTSIASQLVDAARTLSAQVDAMRFAAPVSHVYNPLDYAWAPHEAYLRRFGNGHKRIIFLPDAYLAENTATQLGLPFLDSEADQKAFDAVPADQPLVIGWHAKCEVHELFTTEDVANIRKQYQDAVILAHPECPPEVIQLVDKSGSTKAMVDYVRDKDAPWYALLTECSMGDNLAAEFPHRRLVRACTLRCKHMNYITLEDTLAALKQCQYQVHLDETIRQQALLPIQRMLAIQ